MYLIVRMKSDSPILISHMRAVVPTSTSSGSSSSSRKEGRKEGRKCSKNPVLAPSRVFTNTDCILGAVEMEENLT